MALFNAHPTAAVLAKADDKALQASYYGYHLRAEIELEKKRNGLYNYSCPESATALLLKSGVPVSGASFRIHSHPASKMVENYMLFDVFGSMLNEDNYTFFLSCKERKVEKLLSYKNLNAIEYKTLNLGKTCKDMVRYRDQVADNFTRCKIIRETQTEKSKDVFIHDEVHYWDFQKFKSFIDQTQPDKLFFSVVYPMEILIGMTRSANPSLYSFRIENGDIIFAPDNVYSQSYTQNASNDWFFRRNLIRASNGEVYSLEKVDSLGANHLFLLTKGEKTVSKYCVSNSFEIMDPRFIWSFNVSKQISRVRKEVFTKTLTYLLAIRKKDVHSAIAKVRQLTTKNVLMDEVLFMEFICKKLEEDGYDSIVKKSIWRDLWRITKTELLCLEPDTSELLLDLLARADDLNIMIPYAPFQSESLNSDPCEVLSLSSGDDPFVQEKGLDGKGFPFQQNSRLNLESLPCDFVRFKLVKTPGESHSVSFVDESVKTGRSLPTVLRFFDPSNLTTSAPVDPRDAVHLVQYLKKFLSLHSQEAAHVNGPLLLTGPEKEASHLILEEVSCSSSENVSKTDQNEIFFGSCPEPAVLSRLARYGRNSFSAAGSTEGDNSSVCSHEAVSEPIQVNNTRKWVEQNFTVRDSCPAVKVSAVEHKRKTVEKVIIPAAEFDMPQARRLLEVKRFPGRIEPIVTGAKPKKLSGRIAYHFGEYPYGHDRVVYPQNAWHPSLNVPMEFGHYNSVLYQKYLKGGRIKPHADDEDCYDHGDQILTINIRGKALFKIFDRQTREEVDSFEMVGSTYFIFPPYFQEKYLHSVLALTDRESLTYRVQRRPCSLDVGPGMSFTPRQESEVASTSSSIRENSCFLDALSQSVNRDKFKVLQSIVQSFPEFSSINDRDIGVTRSEAMTVLHVLNLRVKVDNEGVIEYWGVPMKKNIHASRMLRLRNKHFTCTEEVGCNPLKSVRLVDSLDLEDVPNISVGDFRPSIARARKLVETFATGATGIRLSDLDNVYMRSRTLGEGVLKLGVIYGFAGCGKTAPLRTYLKTRTEKILVITPRRFLHDDWCRSMKRNRNITCCTFETALERFYQHKYHLVVFDEIGLFPPGYLDLFSCLNVVENKNLKLICLGDKLQSSYYSRGDNFELGKVTFPSFEDTKYMYYTNRCDPWIENVFDVKSMRQGEKKRVRVVRLDHGEGMPNADLYLCSSFDRLEQNKKQIGDLFKKDANIMTFGQSQGLTVRTAALLISKEVDLCSIEHLTVALTRSIEPPILVFWSDPHNNRHEVIRNIMKGEVTKLSENLREYELIREPVLYGSYEKMECDPGFFGALNFCPVPAMEAVEFNEVGEAPIDCKTHLPIANHSVGLVNNSDRLLAKEFREMDLGGGLLTNQFSEEPPFSPESVYMRHRADDDATFWMSVRKRITFSDPCRNYNKLISQMAFGNELFQIFLRRVLKNRNIDFNDYMEQSVQDLVDKKMLLSENVLRRNAERSDPDWDLLGIKVFLKSQLCTKLEKRFSEAKAGQTISCFQHQVLARFGPYCRATEKALLEALPEKWYLHSCKNFDQLNEWVVNNFMGGLCVDSDYTAFDSSQDEKVLAFELHLLRHLGWPEDLLNDYLVLKLNLGCSLGSLAIMRFTGEFSTFLFNSIANMLFTVLTYKDAEDCPIAFAGDDMLALGELQKASDLGSMLVKKLTLKAKVNISDRPTFCGWIITRDGILKSPLLIYDRLNIAMHNGKVKDVISNYCIEFSYAYRMSDLLYEHFSEEELEYHQVITCLMVDFRHLMSPQARSVLIDS